ncbi:aldehyde dehydrogenase (NAD+) [Reichenbachiella faecimaris]|uniref:Aldehyde dehydrogenase n=1 Tax=Reichenbachiella faecimaris TaxID=692418 RepID=A0A1W2GBG1_REIFA|nr:aldehyde dehydrogenase family protein [Reichenbachiella faecimaris]SMD33941.1 aldehyde dehydrogenase (NAD+) [Reichenbachiella faecimaris]
MANQFQSQFDKQKVKSLTLRTESITCRRQRLKSLKTWILNNKDKIRKALHADLRKSETETDITEIFTVTTEINDALSHLHQWARPQHVSPGMTYLGTSARIKPEPKGVCLIIAPWNFPFNLIGSPLASCLAAGNTAILKPSEHTPATSKLIKEMVEDVFEPELVTVIEGAVPETTALLELPFDHIFFTGSTNVGKIVMGAAAKNLSSVTLELGGKSPVIIDETASADDAARKIVWGRFNNNGQTCIAPDYIFISDIVKDKFVASAKKYVSQLFDSNNEGMAHTKDYSRLVNANHASRLVDMLEEAKQSGAKIEFGGDHSTEDRFIEPTLLSNIDESNRIWQEEIFGPIMPMKVYEDINDVIHHINKNDKPLSLYLFTTSRKMKKHITQATSAGTMVINDVVVQYAHPNLPFGGVNHSGIGKSHGKYGFMEFSNQKSVLSQRIGLTNALLFYPPFNGFKKWVVSFMIKWF